MLNFQKNCNGSDNFGNNAKYQVLSYQLNNQTGSQLRVSLSGDQAAQITLELIAKQGKVLNKQTFYVGSTIKNARFDAQQKAIILDIMDAYGNNRTFYCSLDKVISDLIAAVDAEVANELQLLQQDLAAKFTQKSAAIDSEIMQLSEQVNAAVGDLETYKTQTQQTIDGFIDGAQQTVNGFMGQLQQTVNTYKSETQQTINGFMADMQQASEDHKSEVQQTIETNLGVKPGKITEFSGEIFNDYQNNTALGVYSHSQGEGTTAKGKAQHVQGRYNRQDTQIDQDGYGKYAHIVGGGSATSRKNIHTLDWHGNAEYSGNITSGGDIIATNGDGANVSLLEFYQDVLGRFQQQDAEADSRNDSLLNSIQQNTTDIYNINTGLNLVANRTTALQAKTTRLQAELPKILTSKDIFSSSSSDTVTLEIAAPQRWSVAYCTLQLEYAAIPGTTPQESVCKLTNNSGDPDLLTIMTFDNPWGQGSGTYTFKLENVSYTLQNVQKHAITVSYSAPTVQLYGTSYTLAAHEEALLNSDEGIALSISRPNASISARLTIKWL